MATGILFQSYKNQLKLRDTSTHSYKTNDVYVFPIWDTIPNIETYGIYIYNNTNENISVTPMVNVFGDDKIVPFVTLSPVTVSTNESQYITFPADLNIANYFTCEVSASTAPTSGYVEGFGIIKYAYRAS